MEYDVNTAKRWGVFKYGRENFWGSFETEEEADLFVQTEGKRNLSIAQEEFPEEGYTMQDILEGVKIVDLKYDRDDRA